MGNTIINTRWSFAKITKLAGTWIPQFKRRLGAASEFSSWWDFVYCQHQELPVWLNRFVKGHHSFSPLREYTFTEDVLQVWEYLDRMMLHLLLRIIRSTFRYVISSRCLHLSGPSAIKKTNTLTKKALSTDLVRSWLCFTELHRAGLCEVESGLLSRYSYRQQFISIVTCNGLTVS